MDARKDGLSIALTLPGEASLGAFEAGAVSALLVALQRINEIDSEAVNVDVLTGTSSGALTALLSAGVLLTGEDPVVPLRSAWVTEPSLAGLAADGGRAPLSLDRARDVGHKLLARMLLSREESGARSRRAQQSPVTLEFALSCLRGFSYEIPHPNARPGDRQSDPLLATSHIDWARHRFTADHSSKGFTKEWSLAVDSAVASASQPIAFPPALLERTQPQLDEYRRTGVLNFPLEGAEPSAGADSLWYSDGGLVEREPLGRCIRLAREEGDEQRRRLVLVVRPYPGDAPRKRDPAWTGEADPPRFRETLARAFRIMVTHSVYEDVRRVEKTNNRIEWAETLIKALNETLSSVPEEDRRAKLGEVTDKIHSDKNDWRKRRRPRPSGSAETLLRDAIYAVAGLEHKTKVDVEVVSASDASQLAGGAAGFVAEQLRATDFLVGYAEMLHWLEHGLREYRVGHIDAGVDAARDRAATIPGWIGKVAGAGGRPTIRNSRSLLRIGLRAARVGLANPPAADKIQRP